MQADRPSANLAVRADVPTAKNNNRTYTDGLEGTLNDLACKAGDVSAETAGSMELC